MFKPEPVTETYYRFYEFWGYLGEKFRKYAKGKAIEDLQEEFEGYMGSDGGYFGFDDPEGDPFKELVYKFIKEEFGEDNIVLRY